MPPSPVFFVFFSTSRCAFFEEGLWEGLYAFFRPLGCWEPFFRCRAFLALSERVYEASGLGGRTENSLRMPVRVFSAPGVLGAVFSLSSFSSPLRTRVRSLGVGWPD
jgi:hypothetical protein